MLPLYTKLDWADVSPALTDLPCKLLATMLFGGHSARKQLASKIRSEREEFFSTGLKNVSTGRDFRNHIVQLSKFLTEETEDQEG